MHSMEAPVLTSAERAATAVCVASSRLDLVRTRDRFARILGPLHPEVRSLDVDIQTLTTSLKKLAPNLVPSLQQ